MPKGFELKVHQIKVDLVSEEMVSNIYITISTYTSVCPYGVGGGSFRRRHVTSHFRFLSCTEFLKPSQTAAERGEAELRILDFKTT